MSKCTYQSFVLAMLALYLTFSPLARAMGADSSGGGNAVVCFKNPAIPAEIHRNGGNLLNRFISHIVSVETYDLYVARKRYGDKNLFPADPSGKLLTDYPLRAIQRMEWLVPQFAVKIEGIIKKITSSQIIDQPFGLIKVADVKPDVQYDTTHCVLATMATNYYDGDSFFLHLDRRLFDNPNNSRWSKEVLLLHEFVYMYARLLGAKNSKNARDVVAMLIRKKTELTALQWINFLYGKGFNFDGEKYLGLPGAMSLAFVLQMRKKALYSGLAYESQLEPKEVAEANLDLANFGSHCTNDWASGCLEAIAKLEAAKTPGVIKLASIKKDLTEVRNNKLHQTKSDLRDFYENEIQPFFVDLPYGPALARKEVPAVVFYEVAKFIRHIILRFGSIRSRKVDRFYKGYALNIAHLIDDYFDLNHNPLEDGTLVPVPSHNGAK